MHNPIENKYKGEWRESLLVHRGEACNSIGVLTKLSCNGEMCVFLRDSTGVLSRPTGSGATPEMKTYTLKILNLQAKMPFLNLKHYE